MLPPGRRDESRLRDMFLKFFRHSGVLQVEPHEGSVTDPLRLLWAGLELRTEQQAGADTAGGLAGFVAAMFEVGEGHVTGSGGTALDSDVEGYEELYEALDSKSGVILK